MKAKVIVKAVCGCCFEANSYEVTMSKVIEQINRSAAYYMFECPKCHSQFKLQVVEL